MNVKKTSACLGVLSMLCAPAMAEGPLQPFEPGHGGFLALNALAGEQSSHLDVDDEALLADGLDGEAESESMGGVGPLFEYNYTLASGSTQFYFGVPTHQLLPLDAGSEIGIRHRFQSQLEVQLAVFPSFGSSEMWSDPYLVGAARTETDATTQAGAITISMPAFSASIGAGSLEVDDENSGGGLAALQRDADYQAFELSTAMPLTESIGLMPQVDWVSADAEGEAMSFDQWSVKLAFAINMAQGRQMVVGLGGGKRTYDADHPLFGLTREDDVSELMVSYMQELPNWRGAPMLTVNLVNSETDSNVDFHDESTNVFIAGLLWHF